MSELQVLLLVIALCVVMLLAVLVLFPLLRKNGVKVEELLQALHAGADGAAGLSHAVKSLSPESPAFTTLDQILRYAQIGVAKAEQLYKVGAVAEEERKQAALDFVYGSLTLAGVEPSEELKSVVDGCVEASVHGLGHATKA